MNFLSIEKIITSKRWDLLVKQSLPVNISDIYSFENSMQIIEELFIASSEVVATDGFLADQMRDYCVNLMIILRAKFPGPWKADWKNEAFLGMLCGLVFREEEAFKYIQNAYHQLDDPPQSLLLAYISAGSGPNHFLEPKNIDELSKKAIKKGITYESALHMASLAYEKGEQKQKIEWEKKAMEAEKKNLHTPTITPDVFEEKNGYQYED